MNSKTNVRERIKHISHIALTLLLSLAAILVVYQFVLLPLAEAAPTTDAGRGSDVLSQLGPRTAVTLILAMIVLVGLVFALFISFGRRLQMRSFLGPLVADAVDRSEIARQEARLREDLKSGKIAPKLEPGSEGFNRRYGIPLNEPIPPLRPGVEMDETGRNPRIVGYADGWGNQLPGGTMNPFSGFDNDRPTGSFKPDDGEHLYAFAAKLRTQIPNWTPERLVAEREASRPEDDQPERKKAEMALTAIAIKNEIDRRFLFGYQQEQINAFNKNRSDITASERKRTEDLLPTIDVSSF